MHHPFALIQTAYFRYPTAREARNSEDRAYVEREWARRRGWAVFWCSPGRLFSLRSSSSKLLARRNFWGMAAPRAARCPAAVHSWLSRGRDSAASRIGCSLASAHPHPQTNLHTNTPRCAILLRLSTASRSLHLTDHPTAFFFLQSDLGLQTEPKAPYLFA